jgi:mannose-1-phosphate guanylyltransferase/phosphomannomutase
MLELGMPLYGYIADGYWRDVGNLDEYIIGQYDALTGIIKVEKKGIEQGNLIRGNNCNIAPTAKIWWQSPRRRQRYHRRILRID